ncbi:hypothetical protein LCGC14_1925350 [marine sediment metagenome]|uniref:Uncharacterized protein n=1 Tax=marine sediment metagenome TaxID=412755 RepID=A0A0F9FPG7_9ZZZZ
MTCDGGLGGECSPPVGRANGLAMGWRWAGDGLAMGWRWAEVNPLAKKVKNW